MTVVYLDRVVLLNLAVDYLLLLATARLAGLPLAAGTPSLAADGAVFSAVRGAGGAAAGGRSGGRVPGGHSQPGILRRHQLAGAAGLRHRLWAAAAPGVPPGGAA